jgi:hypothetical protein
MMAFIWKLGQRMLHGLMNKNHYILFLHLRIMRIRKYKESDRDKVREICCDTGLLGDPIDPFMPDRKLWADGNSKYYTDREPESLFILEDKGTVIGYLFGCKDTRKEMAYRARLAPLLLLRVLLNILRRRHISEIARMIKWIYAKYKIEMPSAPISYAHLHINLVHPKRSKGMGTQLMKEYFKYLRKHDVKGVFAQVFKYGKQRSYKFFKSFSMEAYEEKANTLWKDFVPGKISLVTVVKKL